MTKPIDPVALFRLSVLGPLASRDHFAHGELQNLFRDLAVCSYQLPNGHGAWLSPKTIERWYYAWLRGGIEALVPKKRCDTGNSHLASDVQETILAAKRDNPARSISTLVCLLEQQGKVARGELARSSVHRLLKHHQLSKRTRADAPQIERRAFEATFAGDIWYGDVMHGPRIHTEQGRKKAYLVSWMDDASRLICHSAFCLNEGCVAVEGALKNALLKRGLPKKLVVDNGSAYRSGSLQSICARLGIQLIYCRPYEPAGKGKLERWHRSLREQLLPEIALEKLQGLDDLNARLWLWIEEIYHQRPHSALQKGNMTPLARWQQDLLKIRPLGTLAEKIDSIFYHRVKRRVRKDATLSWEGCLFEVPYEVAGSYVYLVIDPYLEQAIEIESLDYEKIGSIHLLDKKANCHRRRQRPLPDNTATQNPSPTKLVEIVYEKCKKDYPIIQTEKSREDN